MSHIGARWIRSCTKQSQIIVVLTPYFVCISSVPWLEHCMHRNLAFESSRPSQSGVLHSRQDRISCHCGSIEATSSQISTRSGANLASWVRVQEYIIVLQTFWSLCRGAQPLVIAAGKAKPIAGFHAGGPASISSAPHKTGSSALPAYRVLIEVCAHASKCSSLFC